MGIATQARLSLSIKIVVLSYATKPFTLVDSNVGLFSSYQGSRDGRDSVLFGNIHNIAIYSNEQRARYGASRKSGS